MFLCELQVASAIFIFPLGLMRSSCDMVLSRMPKIQSPFRRTTAIQVLRKFDAQILQTLVFSTCAVSWSTFLCISGAPLFPLAKHCCFSFPSWSLNLDLWKNNRTRFACVHIFIIVVRVFVSRLKKVPPQTNIFQRNCHEIWIKLDLLPKHLFRIGQMLSPLSLCSNIFQSK